MYLLLGIPSLLLPHREYEDCQLQPPLLEKFSRKMHPMFLREHVAPPFLFLSEHVAPPFRMAKRALTANLPFKCRIPRGVNAGLMLIALLLFCWMGGNFFQVCDAPSCPALRVMSLMAWRHRAVVRSPWSCLDSAPVRAVARAVGLGARERPPDARGRHLALRRLSA